MSPRPTLIFIPGAWHRSDTWDKVVSRLETQEVKCISVTLPTATDDASVGFAEDVEAARSAITAETKQGHDVVVVAHSYGGQVGNSAVKGLARTKQEASDPKEASGHVIGIALMASGFTMTGMTFLGGLGGNPPPSWKLDEESGLATIVVEPRELFYHDLPIREGNEWVSKLTKQSFKAFTTGGEHAYAGWMDVPVWFLATKEDKALPIQAQNMFVGMAKGAGGDVTAREVESSHSPMLSKPKQVVDFLLEAMADFEAKAKGSA